jgi:hypothetical protein
MVMGGRSRLYPSEAWLRRGWYVIEASCPVTSHGGWSLRKHNGWCSDAQHALGKPTGMTDRHDHCKQQGT